MYLARYGINVQYEPNGAALVWMHSKSGQRTKINYAFPTGSLGEVHHGETHFAEHRVVSGAVFHAA